MKPRALTVVGIVDDTRASGIDQDVRPYLYIPFAQMSHEDFALVVRSKGDAGLLGRPLKDEVWKVDKDQPVTHVTEIADLVADSIALRLFQALLMSVFGVFSLVLAAMGIYGVLGYVVVQRTHEIGIRMALGASRGKVLANVLWRASALALVGAASGLSVAYLLAPILRNLLYGIPPIEPWVFAGSAVVLIAVAFTAALIPALRAARLDPAICLRHE